MLRCYDVTLLQIYYFFLLLYVLKFKSFLLLTFDLKFKYIC